MRLVHYGLAVSLAFAMIAGTSTAAALAGTADETKVCEGHVAYVTPITYRCEGDCRTRYFYYIPTGCTIEDENETLAR